MEQPPSYEFAVEEPESGETQTRMSKIIRPMLRVVDPVARKWAEMSNFTAKQVSRVMNPLLAKRIVMVVLLYFICVALYPSSPPEDIDINERERNHSQLISYLYDQIQSDRISHTTEYFNSIPHAAGTVSDHATAEYVREALFSYGLERIELDPVETFITHLEDHKLLVSAGVDNDKREFEVDLTEGRVDESFEQPPPHMSLGLSENAMGPLVYVNFGSQGDLNYLRQHGIQINGAIAVVRFGKGSPALTVERLKDWGAVGVVFFSKKDENAAAWPDGPDYSDESVQRASLGIPQMWPGDPLSPGWPSLQHLMVSPKDARSISKLPVVSVSWKGISPLLESLKGHGVQVPDWHNHGYPKGVEEWWTGNTAPENPVGTLSVKAIEETRHTVYNVLGRIPGTEEPDHAVFIGASLDSFCRGGVKLSGVSVLLEVARALSYLSYVHDWKPLRSIYFTFWDGSTQNFAGATEWMEQFLSRITQDGLAYIDLDKGVWGSKFHAEGNPSIDIRKILESIDGSTEEARTLPWDFGTRDVFSSYAGVPAISLSMEGGAYPKDSCFDSLEWQQKFGDQDFTAHKKLGDITAHLVYELADSAIIGLNYTYAADQMVQYANSLDDYVASKLGPQVHDTFASQISEIQSAIARLGQAGRKAEDWRRVWHQLIDNDLALETKTVRELSQQWNDRLTGCHKQFLQRTGIFRRDWFKNPIYGPQYESTGEEENTGSFPGVRDAVWMSNIDDVRLSLQQAIDSLGQAAQYLIEGPFWS